MEDLRNLIKHEINLEVNRLVDERMKELGLSHGADESNEYEIRKARQAMSCGDL